MIHNYSIFLIHHTHSFPLSKTRLGKKEKEKHRVNHGEKGGAGWGWQAKVQS